MATAGNHLYDISAAIGDYANQFGYGVVEDLCGHGIGSHLHEEPEIPNFRQSRFRRGIKLKPGMTLAVEPMINVGTKDVLWMMMSGPLSRKISHYPLTMRIRYLLQMENRRSFL